MVIPRSTVIQSADCSVILALFLVREVQNTPGLNIAQSRARIGRHAIENAASGNVDSGIESAAGPHMNDVRADVRSRNEQVVSEFLLNSEVPLTLVCRLGMRSE